MKIKEVIKYLEDIVPLTYQESYDNSGLILGDKDLDVKGVLISLDCTEEVLDEAIKSNSNLIISHHPIIFNAIKKINVTSYTDRIIIKAIKNDIAIYALHTNLDNILQGVNGKIASILGLSSCNVMLPKKDTLKYLVVYCPLAKSEKLKKSLFSVGAGSVGNYDQCSFTSFGKGSFRANKDAKPYIGKTEFLHTEEEERIEVIYPAFKETNIIQELKNNHPYEEVAYQTYMISNFNKSIGSGIIGSIKSSININSFLKLLKDKLSVEYIKHTDIVKHKIKKVAICGGSGSFLIQKAIDLNADVFISSDFKYHDYFLANKKIIIIDIGHYESEQFTKDLIYDMLTKKFTKFAIRLSKINTNPINYF